MKLRTEQARQPIHQYKTVERLLADPEWGKWSDNKIAEICKVSHQFVGKYRVHTCNITSMDSQPNDDRRTFIHHKTGKESTMKTGNIGKPLEPVPEPETEPEKQPISMVDNDKLKRERMDIEIVIKGGVELSKFYPEKYAAFEESLIKMVLDEFPGVSGCHLGSEVTPRHAKERKIFWWTR